jgi:hypothetical protein
MSLGIKLRCWYLRSDDDYGLAKRVSDLQDVIFVATLMRDQGMQVDFKAAAQLKICHYKGE